MKNFIVLMDEFTNFSCCFLSKELKSLNIISHIYSKSFESLTGFINVLPGA